MRPKAALDTQTLRANVRAWSALAGVPVRAVVKSDGYGWGFATLVRPLEDLVEAFIVADAEEFTQVRQLTKRPIVTLADTPASEVARLLDGGALPNIATRPGLEAAIAWSKAAGRPALVRVGVRPAMGWAGFEAAEFPALAPLLSQPELHVELWTHVTGASPEQTQRARFAEIVALLSSEGVALAGNDIESSLSLRTAAQGTSVRIGVGLFGARSGAYPADLRCALRLEAPVVLRTAASGQAAGYGTVRAPQDGYLEVVRCGYGDGFARATGISGILSVGMQYTVLWRGNVTTDTSVVLVNAGTDLGALADAAAIAPHELIVRLGLAARAQSSATQSQMHREQ
ncbi:MAG TPA: alanine racemase [Candidatus Baltobacteraceae bacterium]